MPPTALALLALLPLLPARPAPATRETPVRVTLATLHAATLTAPRAAGDTVERPYLLVAVVRSGARMETLRLPATGQLSVRRDEALGARPLLDLRLAPGDTVRVLVSALTGASARAADAAAATASGRALAAPRAAWTRDVAAALAPVTRAGARWLGSAALLLTNERGTTYWRALDCVASCGVLSDGAATTPLAPGAAPAAGIVELSGAGGTYHMKLQVQQPAGATGIR